MKSYCGSKTLRIERRSIFSTEESFEWGRVPRRGFFALVVRPCWTWNRAIGIAIPQGPCHTKNTTVIVIHYGGSKTLRRLSIALSFASVTGYRAIPPYIGGQRQPKHGSHTGQGATPIRIFRYPLTRDYCKNNSLRIIFRNFRRNLHSQTLQERKTFSRNYA